MLGSFSQPSTSEASLSSFSLRINVDGTALNDPRCEHRKAFCLVRLVAELQYLASAVWLYTQL